MNEITIYNADGTPLMSNVPITADAVHEENLMQTDQVNLKWNAAGGYTDRSKPNLINVSELEIGNMSNGNDVPSQYRCRTPSDKKLPVTKGQRLTVKVYGFGNVIGYQCAIYYYRSDGSYVTGSGGINAPVGNSISYYITRNDVASARFMFVFSTTSTTADGHEITTPLTRSELSNLKVMLVEGGTAPDMWYPSEADEAAKHPNLPAGSFVVLNSIRYYLAEDYRPDSKDLGLYTYTPEFLHEVYLLKKMPFLLIDATNNANSIESDWNYTGSLADLCQPLEQAINDALGIDGASPQAYSVQIDAAIENAVSLSFSNMSILDALNAIAEAVNGEWYTDEAINGYTGNHIIHIAPSCLHEGGESSTLAFTAGNQVGFPQSQQKHEFYNRYYVFGSTRNIPQDYNGAQANTVVNKRLTLDPTLHPNGYIDLPQFTEEGEVVTTDDSTKPSFYDENGNVAHYVPDDSLSGRKFVKVVQIDDVYPRANLHVSSIVANTRYVLQDGNKVQTGTDGGGNPVYSTYVVYYVSLQNESNEAFTIDDSTYDPTSNPNGNMIKGLKLSLHFKSGALTGREFEATYHKTASQQENIDGTKVNIPAGCFEIVKIEDNTVIIPNTNIAPVVDDEVIVFNIRMPQAYITSAYKELDKEAMKAIYEEWRDGNEYEVKSNPISFTQNVYNLHIGRHVKLTAWGRLIDTRITKLQTHLDRDFEQTISFTKGIKKGTISTLLTTIEATSARMTQVELKDDSNLHQLRQQLYTAQRELHDMVFDTEGNYYSDKISPVAIETKLIEVGGKSTQLSVSGLTVMPNVNSALTAKDPDHVKVVSNSGKLVHYGLPESPRTWNISNSSTYCEIDLTDSNAYYIYARCAKATGANACTIVFDQTQHVYDETGDYYYFLIGTISSKISDGNTPPSYDRVVSMMYGTTTVSGRFITTGCIQSLDGNVGFDLDNGQIWGTINFTKSPTTKTAIETMATDAGTTAANTAISNLQVGGRNLILDSKRARGVGNGFSGIIQDTYRRCDVKVAYVIGTLQEATTFVGQYKIDGWDKNTLPVSNFIIGGGNWTGRIVFSANKYKQLTETTRLYYAEVTLAAGTTNVFQLGSTPVQYIVVLTNDLSATFDVYELKLEIGNTLSDWTPAPEDETQAMADLANSLEGLEEQIDGKIDTWFKTVDPTTSNEPASTWNSTAKAEHKDDLYYNTETGNVFRWTGSAWAIVRDSQIQEALNNASIAQATADGKMTVFTSTPSNYKRGDMWVQGANGDIKYATKNGTTFDAADWVVASKYTDDTVANQAIANAATAQQAAKNAATAATAAKTRLDNIANDKIVSPAEKPALKQQQNDINSEYASNINEANKYGVSTTDYATAKTNVDTAFALFLNPSTWTNDISIATGSANATKYGYIAAYYTARQTLLDAIATAAKSYVDMTANGGRNYIRGSVGNAICPFRVDGNGAITTYSSTIHGHEVLRLQTRSSISGTVFFESTEKVSPSHFKAGDKVVLSCWCQGDNSSFRYTMRFDSDTSKDIGGTVRPASGYMWSRVEFVGTIPDNIAVVSTIQIFFACSTASRWLNISELQLEKGTVATDWKPYQENETDYLSDALAEAEANVGGTAVRGGLVLSKFIGVRDNSDNVVAGMTATKDANGNKMPMIFAGAVASNQTLRLGKFQVWENGKIVSTNGTNEVHIDEDYIKFYNSGNLKNVITSASGGGITAMSGKATTSDSTTISPTYSKQDGGSITQGDLQQLFVTKYIAEKKDTITFISSPPKSGTINIAAGSIKFYTSTVWTYSGVSTSSGGAISIKLYSGSTVISTLATGTLSALTDNTTLSWTAKNNIAFTANNVLKLEILWNQWQVDLDAAEMDSGTTLPYTISRSYQAQGNIAISWALNEYKNTFYADGFFLSAASNKSFGVDPAMADTEQNLFRIQAPTTGTATQTFCMRPKGLGYSAGSSSLFHLNPLALIVRVTWNSSQSKYTWVVKYNPRGVTPDVAKDGDNCKITHNLNTTDYSVNVVLRNNALDARRAGVQVNIQNTYVAVNVGDHSTSWRADFDIFFYDYSTL